MQSKSDYIIFAKPRPPESYAKTPFMDFSSAFYQIISETLAIAITLFALSISTMEALTNSVCINTEIKILFILTL